MLCYGSWDTLCTVSRRAELVFVYGTLRRGQALHGELLKTGAEYLDAGKIHGRLYDLGDYPGAVPSHTENEEILGELYRLDEPSQQLCSLDAIEEYDPERPDRSLFVRRPAEVWMMNGKRVRAWVYFLPDEPEGARAIVGGDYARRRGSEAG